MCVCVCVCGRKAPIGVEHVLSCLTVQLMRIEHSAPSQVPVVASYVCVCVCVCVCSEDGVLSPMSPSSTVVAWPDSGLGSWKSQGCRACVNSRPCTTCDKADTPIPGRHQGQPYPPPLGAQMPQGWPALHGHQTTRCNGLHMSTVGPLMSRVSPCLLVLLVRHVHEGEGSRCRWQACFAEPLTYSTLDAQPLHSMDKPMRI